MAIDINDLVGDNGRVNFRLLTDFVAHVDEDSFLSSFRHPLFVGKELYDGQMTKTMDTYTMKFSKSQIGIPMDSFRGASAAPETTFSQTSQGSMNKAVYMLRRKDYSQNPPNVITLGRSNNNDMVVADYAVSQEHAQIIIFHGMYFIVDMNSTNGTVVNDRPIHPEAKVKVMVNDTIAFGRLVFVLMSPRDLYRSLQV